MVNLKRRLIVDNQLSIKGGDYPKQYQKKELFRFFLRRAAGKEAAVKVFLKMYVANAPMADLRVCVETILDSFTKYSKQITKISHNKIKKMRQGLAIPKPKLLKNGHNYFDAEEIRGLPGQLRDYYQKKKKEKDLVPAELQVKTGSFPCLRSMEVSDEKMDAHFFEVISLFYYMIQAKKIESELGFEDLFVCWCIKLGKWPLLLQLSQSGILGESLSLCLLFCELGSRESLMTELRNQFELVSKLQTNYLIDIPNLANKEFLQIGLQYLKKQSR